MKIVNCYKISGIIFFVLSILNIIYFVLAKAFNVDFSYFFLPVGVILLVLSGIFLFVPSWKISQNIIFKSVILRAFLALLFISFIVIESLVIYAGNFKSKKEPDYVIVLGAGLRGDKPSLALTERLDTAVKYLNMKKNIKVFVSGGKGKGETVTEAYAMKKYLIEHGIDENRIFTEDKSENTLQNFKFTKKLINMTDKRKNIKLLIITNSFHMLRSKIIAGRLGFTALGYPAKTYYMLIPAYYVREYFGVIKSYIFDR